MICVMFRDHLVVVISYIILTPFDNNMSQSRLRVGILGATGTVGQRFIVLLQNHPQFEITHLGASERSAGQTYKKIVRWKLSQSMPEDIGGLTVTLCDPAHFEGCSLVFSALDSSVAGDSNDIDPFASRDVRSLFHLSISTNRYFSIVKSL